MRASLFGALLLGLTCGVSSVALGDNYDRTINVFNETNSPIVEVYASNVGTNDWLGDLLSPDERIMPGRVLNIDTDDGTGYCKYDLRAVLQNGQEVFQSAMNVCVAKNWTVTPPSSNPRR